MATTRLMPLHIGKGQTAGDAIKRALGYIKDPTKTDTVSLLKPILMCYNISGDENEEIRDNH